jgi:hypothetical protein
LARRHDRQVFGEVPVAKVAKASLEAPQRLVPGIGWRAAGSGPKSAI